MKKYIAMILAVLMVCGLFAGCGASGDGLTVKKGKLTVATSPDFAPFEFYSLDDAGKPTLAGFDIALAQYIADYMGLELEIIPMDFDGTLSELTSKKVDLSMAGYSPDPARENSMDFSDVYYTSGQSFLCTKENASKFPTIADANKPEYQLGVQIGSIQYGLAQENTPEADIVQLSKVTDIIAEVLSGKLDGAFVETAVAETYMKSYPELTIALDVSYEKDGYVIGVSKGNDALLTSVNEAIAKAKEDGSLAKFIEEANVQASSNTFEGLLDAQGGVPTEASN